ncbi:Uncharacterized protein APZ42_031804 [Daphnia magna]|uniref:THAP-type domain-containing protein n=1 Tax=Daphnia magna TaxID=35525 RepID=A0A164MIJ2_9CRUS|nr:Uncharacterized protein APZ42_031804 [Daphnia magna]
MPKVKVCFICGVIDKESDKSLFYIPLGKLEEWQKIIAKPGLTRASRLCEAHFEKSEIHKGTQVGNDFVPATRNRLLTKNVVPTKNLAGNLKTD